LHDLLDLSITDHGTIDHVVNDFGPPTNANTIPVDVVAYSVRIVLRPRTGDVSRAPGHAATALIERSSPDGSYTCPAGVRWRMG
jgi:hypothetical protein